MAFELLVGCPPFADDSPEKIFQNILNRDMFEWPAYIRVSDSAKDLVDKLLQLDPLKRLGANGVDELKNHSFFTGIDWCTVLTAPMDDNFIPKAANPQDTSNFNDNAGLTSAISFQAGTDSIDDTHTTYSTQRQPDFDLPEFTFRNLHHLREKNKEVLAAKMEYEGDYSSEDYDDVSPNGSDDSEGDAESREVGGFWKSNDV